jgi:hypothetical protein
MVMRSTIAFLALVLAASLSISCSRTGFSIAASPSSVVREMYTKCNTGQYSEVEPLLSTDFQSLVHRAGVGVRGICDDETRQSTVTGIDVVSEEIKGEGAKVVVNIHFKDVTNERHKSIPLIKEKGSWKIAVH